MIIHYFANNSLNDRILQFINPVKFEILIAMANN